ncbi:TPR domain containing protein [Beggiatoa sp. PS]|nr:TPR domain containing protein [Beggiatoa sp. PS]
MALLKEKQGNIGAVDQEYTARWLFNQGTKATPSWQAWALLEEKQENIEKAKQIAQQGLQYYPNNSAILDVLRKIENHTNSEDEITILIQQGNCDQASTLLQQALFKNPQDTIALKLWQLWKEKCGK